MMREIARQARALTGAGRPDQALALTAGPAATPDATADLLMAHAVALKAVGRLLEALPFNRRAVEREPGDRIAWYNYAATLGDLDYGEEAVAALHKAMALGLDRPEVHLVMARALTTLKRYDEAERAFEAVLARDPLHAASHRDLAQLVWMRTGDAARALARLEAAMTGGPQDVELIRIKATVQRFAGDFPAALSTLLAAADRRPIAPLLLDLAAMRLHEGDSARTLDLTRRVLAAVPGLKAALEIEAQAHLVGGDVREGARIAEALYAQDPQSQYVLLILTTALRMLGDPRGEALTDPKRFVRTHRMSAPAGWPSREAFLAELSQVVRSLHTLQAHPFQQSLRGGSQTQGLLISEEPVIKAFFHQLNGLIADHIAWLGEGDDPVRSRISGGFRIKAAWSVLLRSSGFHVNHFHPEGWLSSAFYIDTPSSAVDCGDHQGWLKFGEPGIPTVPALRVQEYVRPEPGLLALFPSYFWHGTVPFDSPGETRMTIAFDVVPT